MAAGELPQPGLPFLGGAGESWRLVGDLGDLLGKKESDGGGSRRTFKTNS
jgi:hypothetical protein